MIAFQCHSASSKNNSGEDHTYKNKYNEDAKKIVADEIDDEKCKFKQFVMIDNKSKIEYSL